MTGALLMLVAYVSVVVLGFFAVGVLMLAAWCAFVEVGHRLRDRRIARRRQHVGYIDSFRHG